MRDPKRIDLVLEEVRKAWMKRPDSRLGQLLYNACREAQPGHVPPCPPFFNMEEDELLAGLIAMQARTMSVYPTVGAAQHNHVTRDIKPRGDCPGCDDYYASQDRK